MWIGELIKEVSEEMRLPQRWPHWILVGISCLMTVITLKMVI